MKTCTKCKEAKPLDAFADSKNGKDGKNPQCKECRRAYYAEWAGKNKEQQRAYREANKEKRAENMRRWSFTNKYGITPEQYDEMFEAQNGLCLGCERHQREFTMAFAVDHDHACCEENACGNCVRGLLCGPCNVALGLTRDNAVTLRRLAAYVERYAA